MGWMGWDRRCAFLFYLFIFILATLPALIGFIGYRANDLRGKSKCSKGKGPTPFLTHGGPRPPIGIRWPVHRNPPQQATSVRLGGLYAHYKYGVTPNKLSFSV